MRRMGDDGFWELTETIVSRLGPLWPARGNAQGKARGAPQRVSTVFSSGESNMATGEITGSSMGTLSP
jgi:hypothetical protein